MEKLLRFTENDADLVQKIREYQVAHGLPSFISAVRKLCMDALKIAEIQH